MVAKTKSPKSGKTLVVVESPAKARTLATILGDGYIMRASQGHIRDLPAKKLGVDIEMDFAPDYLVPQGKATIVDDLKRTAKGVKEIYLATDPDREGEAISWHIAEEAGWGKSSAKGVSVQRVVFHEITRNAVLEAFKHPRNLDMQLVNAQQARRILDRLVGYQISPLLWSRVQRGLSAGRVQSVALRLVVEREKEVGSFVPVESWTIESQLARVGANGKSESPFNAVLHSLRGQKGKINIGREAEATKKLEELKGASYAVAEVRTREAKQSPSAPFITSTLQQEAWRKLKFSAKRTMALAQQLYEGVTLGNEGSVGLITYMRTDSTNVSATAVAEAREYIQTKYGKEYLPAKAREHRKKVKGAQEAHEAIRPTSIMREPESLPSYLSGPQLRLYRLIWSRMLASQMPDALSDNTTADIDAACKEGGKIYPFRATGSVLRFPGFRAVYMEGTDDAEEEEGKKTLPRLEASMPLNCLKVEPNQHFTQPPPRYTEASLVKALEEKGIGRPSTYAPIVSTIMERNYVIKDDGRLSPTGLGNTVCDLLTEYFGDVMDVNFTARLEEGLDEVARGEREWVPMLQDFYGPFKASLERATEQMPKVRVEEPSSEVCQLCERPMVIKTGRFGRFLACSGFPECRNRKPLTDQANPAVSDEATDGICDQCGQAMVIKSGRFGRFMACSSFPKCRNRKQLGDKPSDEPSDEVCEKCAQPMVIKKGRFGRFLACTGFPKCRNTKQLAGGSNEEPTEEVCDQCGQPMVMKTGRYGKFLACSGYPKCRNRKRPSKQGPEPELQTA